ncbi:helix-turn-helix domain-containing protein [Streptomyces sp. NPDC050988]|uniref:helix-turn-helix domain-containing protein n=1 Tax=Streptomyces sp. NPDC050988 TaxID=3365637 RepID=UPI0037B123D5
MSELAVLLQSLKERSGMSYAVLARRCNVSTSTLHRYCRGLVRPDSYGLVERFGRECGATRQELHELYEAWQRAEARPAETRPAVGAQPRGGPGTDPDGTGQAAGRGGTASGTVDAGAAMPRPSPQPAAEEPGLSRAVRGPWRWPLRLPVRSALLAALFTLALTTSYGPPVSLPSERNGGAPQRISGPSWSQPPKPVLPELFGVTINSSTGAMPSFHVGAVRLWDSETRWAQLEPRHGDFDWASLDRLVGGARRAGLPVLFTFGGTPSWASPDGPKAPYPDGSRAAPPDDLGDWEAFVRAVVTRYRGRIDAYELWNLAPSPRFFTGSSARLADMTRRAGRIIRGTDPRASVVCPGMGELWEPASRAFLRGFAAAGGYQSCDIASVKLHQRDFGDPPETMVELADIVRRTFRETGFSLPMWNTGTAYRVAVAAPLTEEQAEDYAVRFFLIGLYVRYDRMYFYNWGATSLPIVLQAEGGAPTRAALFIEQLQRWLRGARITSCGHGTPDGLPSNVWQCRLLLPAEDSQDTRPAVIRWTDQGRATMTAESGVRAVRHLDGSAQPMTEGAELVVTERPALIEYAVDAAGSGTTGP